MTPAAPAAVLPAPRVGLLTSFLGGVRLGLARGLAKARAREKAREQKNWLTTKPVSTTTSQQSFQPCRRTPETGDKHEIPYPAPNELREQGRL
jgi:hypothetical protein